MKRLTGSYMVPVLVTDDGEVIQDSKKIVAWAQGQPEGGSMKLYVCWGTFATPRPGGHPCRNAYVALKEAGYEPEVEKVYGLAPLPDTSGRKKVRALYGKLVGAPRSRPMTARSSRTPRTSSPGPRRTPREL